MKGRLWWLVALAIAPSAPSAHVVRNAAPHFLTFDELSALSDAAEPGGELQKKVDDLLSTPFLNNLAYYSGTKPHRPFVAGVGPVLRVTAWNIKTGAEFEMIRMALSDPSGLAREIAARNAAVPEKKRAKPRTVALIPSQVRHLMESDVIILNEVDLGMSRTKYRDIPRELAKSLKMNYAYAVEFIEVDKNTLELVLSRPAAERRRYRGLQGIAILSRYPIRSAKNVPLTVCYDWYGREKRPVSELEKGRRFVYQKAFLERVPREVRHGNRLALVAEIEVPEAATGMVTVVGAHLENKCRPECRREQLEGILEAVQQSRNPLILGGDLNTTGTNGAPTSFKRELVQRARSPHFWGRRAVAWFSPIPCSTVIMTLANRFKNSKDPSAVSIPIAGVNREARLFRKLEEFRFADGGSFDFRGEGKKSANGRGGKLANSNERALKGFTPTFEFKRDFKGVSGQVRLDWLFVKQPPHDPADPLRFAPQRGRTLQLNRALPGRISDHHPITVDLPLS